MNSHGRLGRASEPSPGADGGIIALSAYSSAGRAAVFVGAHCLDARVTGGLSCDAPMINPYPDAHAVSEAARHCWSTSLDLCRRLGPVVADVVGETHGPSYWEAVLLPWLAVWVENVYDRYLRLKIVRERYPGVTLERPVVGVGPPIAHSHEVITDDDLQLQNVRLFDRLMQGMALGNRVVDLPIELRSRGETPAGLGRAARAIRRRARRLLRPTPYRRAGLPWFELEFDSFTDTGFAARPVDRSRLAVPTTGGEFDALLVGLLPEFMPRSLVEEHVARRQQAQRWVRRHRIEVLFQTHVLWGSDSAKYLIAVMREAGRPVIGRQHGGGYGCYDVSVAESVERRICDYFVTWGWSDAREGRTIPLPDPRLSSPLLRMPGADAPVLYVGSHGPISMFRYQHYWMPEFVASGYTGWQGTFLHQLEGHARAALVYRPFVHDHGWGERARIARFLPGVTFDERRTLRESLGTCRLVVIDHPSTSILEALAWNVPTVAFWDPTVALMRPDAAPSFERLRRAGILFDDPARAADHVNHITGDPEAWWQGAGVQAARVEFCHRFAWGAQDWPDRWAKTLGPVCGSPAGGRDRLN